MHLQPFTVSDAVALANLLLVIGIAFAAFGTRDLVRRRRLNAAIGHAIGFPIGGIGVVVVVTAPRWAAPGGLNSWGLILTVGTIMLLVSIWKAWRASA